MDQLRPWGLHLVQTTQMAKSVLGEGAHLCYHVDLAKGARLGKEGTFKQTAQLVFLTEAK